MPSRLIRLLEILLLACLLPVSRAHSAEREAESGPELVLRGSHAVQPGQLLVLEWTAAQNVEELEILLSLDGGRTYPLWISPRLQAGDRRFVWRVPPGLGPSLRMRIRYNRGGREIEGAPTVSMNVRDSGTAQPIGLPPAPEDSPRNASGTERGIGSLRADDARPTDGPEAPTAGPRAAAAAPATAPLPRLLEHGPAFVPLRA